MQITVLDTWALFWYRQLRRASGALYLESSGFFNPEHHERLFQSRTTLVRCKFTKSLADVERVGWTSERECSEFKRMWTRC